MSRTPTCPTKLLPMSRTIVDEWRSRKAYKNLAQGGGLAEPWVLAVKKHVALKERKNPSNAGQ